MITKSLSVTTKAALIAVLVLGWMTATFAVVSPASAQDFTVVDNDRDDDGIPNDSDRCPDSAGPRTNNGCPERATGSTNDDAGRPNGNGGSSNNGSSSTGELPPDTDGDGTADPQDQCPTTPGDGANGGCPEGQTSEPTAPQIELVPMPVDGPCVVSPSGTAPVNMRNSWSVDAQIVDVLQVNEMRELWAVVSTDDPQYPTWYLLPWGYVASQVVRLGGDCSSFFNDPQVGMPGNVIMAPSAAAQMSQPYEIGDKAAPLFCDEITPENAYAGLECIQIDAEGQSQTCVLVSEEAGVYSLDCEESLDLRIPLLYFARTASANLMDCDEITPENAYPGLQCVDTNGKGLPQLCTLVSAEAGVYSLECVPHVGSSFAAGDLVNNNPVLPEIVLQASFLDCDSITPETAYAGLQCVGSDDFGNATLCTLVSNEAGVYSLECVPLNGTSVSTANDVASNPAQPQIVLQATFLNCDQITPETAYAGLQCLGTDGFGNATICTLVSNEAGVYSLDCAQVNGTSVSTANSIASNNTPPPVELVANFLDCDEITPENAYAGLKCVDTDAFGNAVICTLVSSEAGVYTLDCNPLNGTNVSAADRLAASPAQSAPEFEASFINCDSITPENAYAGLQCLDTDNNGQTQLCTLVSEEAGVYDLECVPFVNPVVPTMPNVKLAGQR